VTLLQKEEFRGVVEEEKNTKDVINPPKKSSETIKIKRKIQK
jgi:hypothetical protein